MKLTFSNVGRFIEKTEVEINGITLIAGINGTGKSTISKILYCIFDSLHNIGEQIEANRIASIERILLSPIRRMDMVGSFDEMSFDIVNKMNNRSEIEDITYILNKYNYPLEQLDDSMQKELIGQINNVFEISDEEILEELVFSRFLAEFGDRIQHVNYEEIPAKISLLIKDKSIAMTVSKKSFSLDNEIELAKDIVYMDDLSSIWNSSFRRRFYSSYETYSHISRLQKKIMVPKVNDNDALDKIIAENRYAKIVSKLEQIDIGDIVKSDAGVVEYRVPGLSSNIGMKNVSAGTKVMAVIKKMITNGYIEENGIIVLDEPEVHLHPEWQIVLAELIVIMQCEMGMNVVINTHSADFVAFIQHYAKRKNIEEKCKYYISVSDSKHTSILKDVTGDTQVIFSDLGLPFIRVTEEEEFA